MKKFVVSIATVLALLFGLFAPSASATERPRPMFVPHLKPFAELELCHLSAYKPAQIDGWGRHSIITGPGDIKCGPEQAIMSLSLVIQHSEDAGPSAGTIWTNDGASNVTHTVGGYFNTYTTEHDCTGSFPWLYRVRATGYVRYEGRRKHFGYAYSRDIAATC